MITKVDMATVNKACMIVLGVERVVKRLFAVESGDGESCRSLSCLGEREIACIRLLLFNKVTWSCINHYNTDSEI